MPKIRILLLGQNHNDPAVSQLLLTHLTNRKNLENIVVCLETYSNNSLEEKLTDLQFKTDFVNEVNIFTKRLLSFNNKKELSTKINLEELVLNLRYINKSNVLKAITDVQNESFQQDKDSYYGKFRLLQLLQFIKKNQIPFYGIDLTRQELTPLSQQKHANSLDEVKAIRHSFEPKRIESMVLNIIKSIEKHLVNTGGDLFVCDLGMVHAHRLAANLSQALEKKHFPDNLTIEILTFRIESPSQFSFNGAFVNLDILSQDYEQINNFLTASIRDIDSFSVQQYYHQFPVISLKTSQLTTEEYTCPALDTLLQENNPETINHQISTGSNSFFISFGKKLSKEDKIKAALQKCTVKKDDYKIPSEEVALCRASAGGMVNVMETLLENVDNLNINRVGSDSGKTALHFAVIFNRIEAAKLLLRYKAETNITDKENKTVIDYAKESSNSEMLKLFQKHLELQKQTLQTKKIKPL